MNELFTQNITNVYKLFTGRPLTDYSASISSSFANFAFKLIFVKVLVMASTILAGTFLGANRYGDLALVLAIGNFLCLPFFTCWGLAYVKFASESKSEQVVRNHLNATLTIVMFIIMLGFPILLAFRKSLANLINVSPDICIWGCVFGVLMGGYYFSKNIFQANQNWSSYIACEYFFAGSLSTGILVLFLTRPFNRFGSMLTVFALAHILVILLTFPKFFRRLHLPKSDNLVRIMLYGFGLLVSFSLSLLAMQLDKLLLNYYTDSGVVGRYQAYYVSTFGLLSGFSIILNNYLLPLYGKHSKKTVKNILTRFLTMISLPLWLCCFFFGRLAFFIFGKSFNFNWIDLIWASTFSVVNFWLQILVFFSMTLGGKALFFNSIAYSAFMAVQLITMPFLITHKGISGAFQGMTAASLVGFCVVLGTITVYHTYWNKKVRP